MFVSLRSIMFGGFACLLCLIAAGSHAEDLNDERRVGLDLYALAIENSDPLLMQAARQVLGSVFPQEAELLNWIDQDLAALGAEPVAPPADGASVRLKGLEDGSLNFSVVLKPDSPKLYTNRHKAGSRGNAWVWIRPADDARRISVELIGREGRRRCTLMPVAGRWFCEWAVGAAQDYTLRIENRSDAPIPAFVSIQ